MGRFFGRCPRVGRPAGCARPSRVHLPLCCLAASVPRGTASCAAGCAVPARLPVLPAVLRLGHGFGYFLLSREPLANLQRHLARTRGRRSHRSPVAQSHPATISGGGRLKGQSKVLPCVIAGSGVSATLQRLWPGAQWTVAVPGPRGHRLMYGATRKTTRRRSHCHLSSTSVEARGNCKLQEGPVDELDEDVYQHWKLEEIGNLSKGLVHVLQESVYKQRRTV